MTPEENARLEAIERRLEWIERRLGKATSAGYPAAAPPHPTAVPAAPAPAVSGAAGASSAVPPPSFPLPAEPASAAPDFAAGPPAAAPGRRDFETALGLTWLSRIAVLTIALALAFFFKYAFENRWITEWGRVSLGLAAGLAVLAMGERTWRSGQALYAQALTAAGIVFFYLSFWACFGLYSLLPQSAAFAFMVGTSTAGAFLAWRYQSPAVAILALAGGFATPLLVSAARDPWFLFGYVLILDLSAAAAARYRGWRWTELLAVAGTVLLYIRQAPVPADLRLLYATFVVAWYVLFAASEFPPVLMSAQVFATLAMVQIWDGGAGSLLAVLLASTAGVMVAALRGWVSAISVSWLGFWIAYAAWSTESPHPPALLTLALLTGALAVFLGWTFWSVRERGAPLPLQALILLALQAGFYFSAGHGLLRSEHASWTGLFAIFVAVAYAVLARTLWQRDGRAAALAAGVAWVLLVLAIPVQFAGYRITVGWALEAAALAWIGARYRDRRPTTAAFVVLGLVLVRLAFSDSFLYSLGAVYFTFANPRFLSFAASAAALWATAWWTGAGRRALAAYLAGLAVMLWGLSLEAAGWATRLVTPPDYHSVASTAVSVAAAAYALVLVAAGVARRSAVTRVAGIFLICLVLVKLYLYDVWLLTQFYRMVAFAVLGVLLLAMSYLYSRFRGSIQGIWRSQS